MILKVFFSLVWVIDKGPWYPNWVQIMSLKNSSNNQCLEPWGLHLNYKFFRYLVHYAPHFMSNKRNESDYWFSMTLVVFEPHTECMYNSCTCPQLWCSNQHLMPSPPSQYPHQMQKANMVRILSASSLFLKMVLCEIPPKLYRGSVLKEEKNIMNDLFKVYFMIIHQITSR